jgi:hypothetical protein
MVKVGIAVISSVSVLKNVDLFLCLFNWALRHEDIWGSEGTAPPFLTSALDEVSGQPHAPADLP